ncbi:MAG: glycosyltransferase family 4 protein [Lachnospiraceae bacterium]|nr:glycosyltransferase family 4 protein [Lachnospiraceae bacterium]
MKTIWIIDHYSSEPKYGGISRQYDFARELGKRGYNVVIIASSFSHFTHSYISEENVFLSEVSPNVHYAYLKTISYQNNNGLQRAKSMFDFLFKVLKYEKKLVQKFGKPDVVTGCSIHPLAWVAAYRISRKYKICFCVEVRDFWPRIWTVAGEKRKYDPMVLFFGAIQKWAYKKADRIIYSMYHGEKYICGELGFSQEKTFWIGQPMDCERFDNNAQKCELLPKEIKEFIADSFVCSFAGYYMTYEGVYVMLEAAGILKERNIPIKMVFIGSGQEKQGMLDYVEENNLDNVLVYDRIAKELVPALLSKSDVCMAHLEVEGHKEVYKYGVSKNKVTEYLYSGACTLYGFLYKDDAVATSGAGYVFEPYDAKDLAEKIEMIYTMEKKERCVYGQKGREYIRRHHSVEVIVDQLLNVLFG